MSQERIGVNWFDRNPQSICGSYIVTHTPHEDTERLSYECPQDKMALIEILQVKATRITDADPAGRVASWWFYYSPKFALSSRILSVGFADKTVGAGSKDSAVSSLMLFPKDELSSHTLDLSTGGSVHYEHLYKGVLFDPFPIEYEKFPTEIVKPDIQKPYEKPWWEWWW